MRLLLDTQIFIWWSFERGRLSERVTDLLADRENELFLSIASVWEMQIKLGIGKLSLRVPLPELLARQQQNNDLSSLAIEFRHIYALEGLPHHHRDPFDRLLVAQSRVEHMILLSVDEAFDRYPVQRLW
jgi:PIN domain nuclease of toxin-antitoxin system